MSYRIAWFKINRPAAFYATYFSVKTSDFNAENMLYGIEKVMRYHAAISSNENASAKEKSELVLLEVVYEFYKRGLKFANIDIHRSKATDFAVLDENTLLAPLVTIPGLGENAAQSIVIARQKGDFDSVEELNHSTSISKTVIEKMKELHILDDMPESAQESLFV
jgi:DNA polymerase-3 subunit alpha (Gram-positive type)